MALPATAASASFIHLCHYCFCVCFAVYIYLLLLLVSLFVCYFVCFFVHLVVMFPDTNGLPLLLTTGHQQRHCVLFALCPIYGDCFIILIKICTFISSRYVL